MATTYFLNMNGQTFGQVAAGASQMYGLDHLGSVVQTLDNNGLAQNQYRYHPYGTVETASEPGPAPFYKWVGSLGYRPTGRSYSDYYMESRHYGSAQAGWVSADPLWSSRGYPQYNYTEGDPMNQVDPAGLSSCQISEKDCCDQGHKTAYAGAAGGCMCCDGKKVGCNFQTCPYRICKSCTDHHEQIHFPQTEPCDPSGVYPCDWRRGFGGSKSECDAYLIEIRCYVKNIHKECKSDPVCLHWYQALISGACCLMKESYHCPALPPICRSIHCVPKAGGGSSPRG